MTDWLLPILGIVVIGVLIELITKNSPMGKFIRSIYGFFVLFIIVQPIPKIFNGEYKLFEDAAITVNADLLNEINTDANTAKKYAVKSILEELGYQDCLIYIDGGSVYINSGANVDGADLIKIKQRVSTAAEINEERIFVI
jgi:hypothetical protein